MLRNYFTKNVSATLSKDDYERQLDNAVGDLKKALSGRAGFIKDGFDQLEAALMQGSVVKSESV